MREKRISKLESDATDDVGVDADADDEDFDVRGAVTSPAACASPCAPRCPAAAAQLSLHSRATGLGLGRGGLVEEAQGHEATQHADAGRQEAECQPEQELHRGKAAAACAQAGHQPRPPRPRPSHRLADAHWPRATAAGHNGVRQVPEARAELPVDHHPSAPPPAATLLRGVRRGGAVYPPAGWRKVHPRTRLPAASAPQHPPPR